MAALLIVDDEPVLAHQLAVALRSNGHEVLVAETAAEGLDQTVRGRPELVLLDLRLPDGSGLDLIPELLDRDPNLMIVLMTAYGTVEDAVEALRRGAADYLHKPLNLGELGLVIDRLLREQRRERELLFLRDREGPLPLPAACFQGRLGAILDDVQRLCDRTLPPGRRPPVLLTGEPGSGRGELARAIHRRMGGGPFLAISCSEVDAARLSEELFGVEAGSADGRGSLPGLFEAAEGGTVYLEEVTALPRELQGALLRAITERRVQRAGSQREREINVHLLASTDSKSDEAEAKGFSPELYRELRRLSFELPPLRERPEDLPRLARHFAALLGVRHDGRARQLDDDALARLADYAWPQNLPELRNVLERALFLTQGEEISAATLDGLLRADPPVAAPGEIVLPEQGICFEDVERDLLRQALARTRGNRTRASALVGLSRDTFRYRMARLGLEAHGSEEAEE